MTGVRRSLGRSISAMPSSPASLRGRVYEGRPSRHGLLSAAGCHLGRLRLLVLLAPRARILRWSPMKTFDHYLAADTDNGRLLRSLLAGNSDAMLAARLAFELGRQSACDQLQQSLNK